MHSPHVLFAQHRSLEFFLAIVTTIRFLGNVHQLMPLKHMRSNEFFRTNATLIVPDIHVIIHVNIQTQRCSKRSKMDNDNFNIFYKISLICYFEQ